MTPEMIDRLSDALLERRQLHLESAGVQLLRERQRHVLVGDRSCCLGRRRLDGSDDLAHMHRRAANVEDLRSLLLRTRSRDERAGDVRRVVELRPAAERDPVGLAHAIAVFRACRFAASKALTVPTTLTRAPSGGSALQKGSCSPARWTTFEISCSPRTPRSWSRSVTSPGTSVTCPSCSGLMIS